MKKKCFAVALLVIGLLLAAAPSARADTFNLTSCHIGTGCPTAGTIFGTVTLTADGTGVDFDVELINGNRFASTGAGGAQIDALFLFNDALTNSTVTNIASSPNTPT